MRTHAAARIAAVLLALEGLAIVGLVVWQIGALVSGDTDSIESAIALVVLTAVGAVAVLAFAVVTWRGRILGSVGRDRGPAADPGGRARRRHRRVRAIRRRA